MMLQIVVMGVSGTGKSSVARGLADALDREMVEGDDLHPPENVAKMSAGEPLDDDDRAPWLDRIADRLDEHTARGSGVVLTCSALRRRYRDRLRGEDRELFFVHLHAPADVLTPRMALREGHFMPGSLLRSQLDTLEHLEDDEPGVLVDVTPDLETVTRHAVAEARRSLSRR